MRIYADTSIFGGVFDLEFSVASNEFFTEAVNVLNGYTKIGIYSPLEIINYEN